MSYVVVTDTSANLPTNFTERAGIRVIPFVYRMEGLEHTCTDTRTFDGGAYYGKMRERIPADTAQINPYAYEECFEEILKNGDDVLYIGMSSGISGSFHSAQLAQSKLCEQYPARDIRMYDTLAASLGEGLVAVKAAELLAEGRDIEEIDRILRDQILRMCQIFIVDDISNLKRTGRLYNTVALAAAVLQIKPLLMGNEQGQIICLKLERGRRRAIDALVKKYAAFIKDAEHQTIGIAHADCEEDAAYLAQRLREVACPKEILTVMYEPVTGAHVGPGALALFFLGDGSFRGHK